MMSLQFSQGRQFQPVKGIHQPLSLRFNILDLFSYVFNSLQILLIKYVINHAVVLSNDARRE